jgi:hypothetical protein
MYARKNLARLGYGVAVAGVGVAVVLHRSTVSQCDVSKEKLATMPLESALVSIRPDPAEYEPIPWNTKKNEHMIKNHALFDTLHTEDRVEAYEIYKHKTKQEILAVLKFGNSLNGYPQILHGGMCAFFCSFGYPYRA